MFIASFFMKTIRLILCSLTKFKGGNVLIWYRLESSYTYWNLGKQLGDIETDIVTHYLR